MKCYLQFGNQNIFNSSCIDVLKNMQSNNQKYSMIMADWPFQVYDKLYKEVINRSIDILKDGGNFISVLYPENNYYIRKECEDKGLIIGDEISFKMKMTYCLHKNQLPRRTLNALIMTKGSLDNRIWYGKQPENKRMFAAEKFKEITNAWTDVQFKNGFYRKHLKLKHSEAMPYRVVKDLLKLTVNTDDNVLDLFGGSGNVASECMKRNIPCITTEIQEDNCKIIKKRLENYI